MIRPATLADLPDLVRIEGRCFATDRLTARQFRYMLTKAHAATLLAERDGGVAGYVLILFSRGTSMARLYSIAVLPEQRGHGLATALTRAAEAAAVAEERAYMRLEIRRDNPASIALFNRLGYAQFGEVAGYYEDQMDALRFERRLATHPAVELAHVPYYEQTLEFTCGPAALMMAMKALRPELALDRKLELRLWREATTIYMTSGHGGCGPFGLALAAARRGFAVEVHVNDAGVHLIDSVRNEHKKEVIRLVQEDMLDELLGLGVPVHYAPLGAKAMEERFAQGCIPVVLTSSWAIYQEKFPHWVVVTGFDGHFVYTHDPFIDYDLGETPVDAMNLPIPKQQFGRMTRYGKAGLQATLILCPNT